MKPSALDHSAISPVAVVGYAFRFPGDLCDGAALWDALKLKRDLVTEVPKDRWAIEELKHSRRSEPGRSITFSAGVLSRIDEFDAGFFGISPREAMWLDPQQRLLLELSWEAMENAGIVPSSIAGTNCAVYVGISSLDYGVRGLADMAGMTSHSMTGNTLSLAANRLSYFFDLRGPSLAVDTACSSSLVALHHACNSLRSGEASMAMVGGVNLLLHPYPFVGFSKASMLSADGRCRPFDEAGGGYVRSEGSAVLLLKPLAQALRDGDAVQALILASGVNADGARKTGITIPSSDGQAELMSEVLGRSGLRPEEVDFIEAHGTGTAVGDPVETAAIGRVYGSGRTRPLPIGSVKANLGHLESASGMAGIIKAMLALKNRALPGALHLHTHNPHIDFAGLKLQTVADYTPLNKPGGKPLVAGINSFGFGGANAHVLLQEFQPDGHGQRQDDAWLGMPPLMISARSDAALRALAQRYAQLLRDKSESQLREITRAVAHGRERLEKRLALRPRSVQEAVELLDTYAQGQAPERVYVEEALAQGGAVAFVYSGNGAQWLGMGRAQLAHSPLFAAAIDELDAAMRPQMGFSLVEQLQAENGSSRLDDTSVAQPLLFAIQVAATRVLREAGLVPDVTFGHSVGEVAAAWAAGALDLEQAIEVVCVRSRAQAQTRGMGRMAALGMAPEAARQLIGGLQLDVEIAGINSPDGITLSGSLQGLQRIQKVVEPQGIFFRLLDLDYAFHSRQMDSVAEPLGQWLHGLAPGASDVTFVSTVTGDVLDGQALDSGYWWRNVRQPVLFAQAVTKAAELGCRVFIEVGPHAILQRYISDTLAAAKVKGRVLPTLRRGDGGWHRLEEAALRAHLHADSQRIAGLFALPLQRMVLPNYPWQRQRHWHPCTNEGVSILERRRVHPLLGWRLEGAEAAWENTLDPLTLTWLADHQVSGAIVFPGAAYAEMAIAAAQEWLRAPRCAIEPLDIVAPMVFDGEHGRTLRFNLNPRDGSFQITSRQRLSSDEWTVHASGRVRVAAGCAPAVRIGTPSQTECRLLDQHIHYRLAAALGLNYGPSFQGLQKVCVSPACLQADVVLPAGLDQRDYLLHPALLDVCFQTLVDFFAEHIETGQGIAFLPVKMGHVEICAAGTVTQLRAQLVRHSQRSVLADFELLDDGGRLVAIARGCRFRAAHFNRQQQPSLSDWRITPWLKPHPLEGASTCLPTIGELLGDAAAVLGGQAAQRRSWFRQTLPLVEALVLSFAYEACQQLLREHPHNWTTAFDTAHGRWLAKLMREESLLAQADDGSVLLAADPGLPPAQELWRVILQDNPSCLPQLSRVGRVGRHLAHLLGLQADASSLMDELRQSPVAEALHQTDPVYAGMRLALESMLVGLACRWPLSRRLRVLEVSAGPSELPHALMRALSPEQLEYVLVLEDAAVQARQSAEYREHPGIFVTRCEPDRMDFAPPTGAPARFDMVILRHSLHRCFDPLASLARMRDLLAVGGILVVAERHADWSADFVEGLNPGWWQAGEGCVAEPASSLLPPQSWQRLLETAGFADSEVFIEPEAQGIAAGAYLLLGRRPDADVVAPAVPLQEAGQENERTPWLLLADEASLHCARQLGARLESRGGKVTIAAEAEASALAGGGHVVYLLGWAHGPDCAAAGVSPLLGCVQALGGLQDGRAPRLWVVTRGGALASELPAGFQPRPAQAALWGFGRVVMNEYPQLACTLVELDCGLDEGSWLTRLENELLHPDGSHEIFLGEHGRYCLALQEARLPASMAPHAGDRSQPRVRLDFNVPGQLRNLVWLAQQERALGDDEVEVRTQAVGLNFRDVMYLMGLLPDEAVENGFAGASLGLEFSGVVSRVGAQVRALQPGDAVMGFGSSCFASHVITPAHALVHMPAQWSFDAAATVPTAFFTVYYAFKQLADLQPGERVLIHGAAGGVGIAALQLARHLGAQIYATAGSDDKRDLVRLLGADHVFDSRSLSFAEDVLAATDGEGVDVVLNSLAGEAMRRSLDVLKPFGRFLELGKRDFFENTPLGLRPLRNNISYFGIDADQLLTGRPLLAARLFKEVMALFQDQVLTPLPYRSFGADRVVDAFRVMQQARHIGKLVVSMTDLPDVLPAPHAQPVSHRFSRQSCWLVTGGLSGFGLESARWLAAQGVGHLALVGRRGAQTPGVQQAVDALVAQGVDVLVVACDVSDAGALSQLMLTLEQRLPALTGVLHAAAHFDDRMLASLDEESIASVLKAKLYGAWNLHRATEGMALQHFVLYSSMTTAIGNPGQANYVAANAGLEALALLRRRKGLPATCLAWGPIGDVGYLARNQAVQDGLGQRLGKPPLSAAQALEYLGRAMDSAQTLSMPANFDWNVLGRLLPSATGSRFGLLNLRLEDQPKVSDVLDLRVLLAQKSPEEAFAIVRELVTQEVAQILGIAAEGIQPQASLHGMGMDSLMAVELALGLEQRCGIQLPAMMLNDAPTVCSVTARILERLAGDGPAEREAQGADDSQAALVSAALQRHGGDEMAPDQMRALAADTRRLAQDGASLIP